MAVDRLDSTFYMPLWSREELCEAALVLGLPLAEVEINERFGTFGGEARYCLHPQATAVTRAEVNLVKAIQGILCLDEMDELLMGTEPCELRNRLVHCTCCDHDATLATSAFASPFVENTLVDHVLSLDKKEKMGIRKWLRKVPFAAKLRQRIYEDETHDALCRACELELKPLDRATLTERGFESVAIQPTILWQAEFEELGPSLAVWGPYHKPTSTAWNSITSFYLPKLETSDDEDWIVTAEEVEYWISLCENRLLLFQATVAMTHAVDATGLIHVLNGLGLLESVARNPQRASLVFVVPQKNLARFRRKVITQPTAEIVGVEHGSVCRGDCWRAVAQIPQYVCSWGD